MRNITYILFGIMLLPLCVYSKEFSRYYTYRAGDDDSKNSARASAIEQVKLLLLEEIGVYIQSYIEIDQEKVGSGYSAYLSHEIKTTAAGITKTEVVSESWDGKEYSLHALINIDVEDVIERVIDAVERRRENKNLEHLRKAIRKRDAAIEKLDSELNRKKLEWERQQTEISLLTNEITRLRIKLNDQAQRERRLKDTLGKIKVRIDQESSLADRFVIGMTEREIISIAGKPSAREVCMVNGDIFMNYGRHWAHLTQGVLKQIIDVGNYSGACEASMGL